MLKNVRDSKPLRFALVGTTGFIVDAFVLTALITFGWNVFAARAVSFLSAVAWTYLLNRRITFRAVKAKNHTEGARIIGYGVVQISGALINLGVFSLLVWTWPAFVEKPFLPLAAGSLVALAFNYPLSAWLFRKA